MNPYRIAHTLMALWPLYVLVAIFFAVGVFVGWAFALKIAGVGALVLAITALVVAYEQVMFHLETKAHDYVRRKRSSGRTQP